MVETISIKKYGNRRFYSSKEKTYVTIAEIKTWVQKGHRIQVTDANTEQDITSEILTQILLEQGRASHLPVEILEQMIRMNEKTLTKIWAPLLEQNLRMMSQMGEVALSGFKMLAQALPTTTKTKSSTGLNAKLTKATKSSTKKSN